MVPVTAPAVLWNSITTRPSPESRCSLGFPTPAAGAGATAAVAGTIAALRRCRGAGADAPAIGAAGGKELIGGGAIERTGGNRAVLAPETCDPEANPANKR